MEFCLLTRLSVLEVSTSFWKFLEFAILNGLGMYLIILSESCKVDPKPCRVTHFLCMK